MLELTRETYKLEEALDELYLKFDEALRASDYSLANKLEEDIDAKRYCLRVAKRRLNA